MTEAKQGREYGNLIVNKKFHTKYKIILLLPSATLGIIKQLWTNFNIIESEVLQMKAEQLLQYSAELALLVQLFQKNMITENEYQSIKQKLMKEYKITSDLTAMIA